MRSAVRGAVCWLFRVASQQLGKRTAQTGYMLHMRRGRRPGARSRQTLHGFLGVPRDPLPGLRGRWAYHRAPRLTPCCAGSSDAPPRTAIQYHTASRGIRSGPFAQLDPRGYLPDSPSRWCECIAPLDTALRHVNGRMATPTSRPR
ncbi:hypothetical protein K466DRAFT_333677 [Polyporus arcularius HHB13444]|uniref:Uncharacterized protein n=1 Tax=Polyporus arcularius HHB13444 TaxID=1314778 RepID=A0A5C3NVU9_9APHY|nr:hypothetical protein K466DRAFT_333677 [Polyporus arcularius HHB13444]